MVLESVDGRGLGTWVDCEVRDVENEMKGLADISGICPLRNCGGLVRAFFHELTTGRYVK